jgi:hypothetical protein
MSTHEDTATVTLYLQHHSYSTLYLTFYFKLNSVNSAYKQCYTYAPIHGFAGVGKSQENVYIITLLHLNI